MKINKVRLAYSLLALTVITLVAPTVAFGLFAVGLILGSIAFFKGDWRSDISLGDIALNDTTYAGEAAAQFILKSITGADTVNSGSLYIKDGVHKKFTIPRWDSDYSTLIQDYAAEPTSQGLMTVDGQSMTPANYNIYMEFDPRVMEDHWSTIYQNPTLIDRALPPTMESIVVQGVLQRHAKYFNKMIWQGDTTSTGIYKYFDGFLKKAEASSDTIQVASPTTLTSSNIQAEMFKAYQDIPLALRYNPDMKFFVSYATWDLYAQSQISQTYKGIDTTQEGIDKFKGHPVVRIADFPDNVMVVAKGLATPESNMWCAINSMSDEGLRLARKNAYGNLWFIKMEMKVDVNFGWNGEVVLYGTF